jgi:PAS domain S-box-containing protein
MTADPATLLFPERQMPVTERDSIDMEKPEWLTQMEAVLEVLNEGVIISNDRRQILFANSRFVEMIGIPLQDLIGFDRSHVYSPQEWALLTQQMDITLRDGRNRYAFVLPQKGGSRLPVIISSRTFQNSGSRFEIVTFTDISEQVRAEEELRSANEKLQNRQMEIEEDLRLAARVQQSLVPKSLVWDAMSVDAFYHPVHSIGGDFALVNSQDHEHLSLLVCDVSGHGIGSALVANRIYSETTSHLRSGTPFPDMFGELNRFLMEDIGGSGLFVTVAAARINAHRRTMVFAGAGHPPAMLARGGQEPLLLESRSMILGALPDAVDVTASPEVQLQPDDRVLLYTDGITEVFNSRGEMLGVEGVQEIVRQASFLPANEMKQAILDGVAAWREGPPTDDVSLMLLHVR